MWYNQIYSSLSLYNKQQIIQYFHHIKSTFKYVTTFQLNFVSL